MLAETREKMIHSVVAEILATPLPAMIWKEVFLRNWVAWLRRALGKVTGHPGFFLLLALKFNRTGISSRRKN